MINPAQITNFHRTDSELQAFWLFGAFCAGKNSDFAARSLARLLQKRGEKTPFEYLRDLGENGVRNALVASRVGNYTRLTRFVRESLDLDLRNATLDDLLKVHGIGNKTARFFLLHSRPNQRYAVLDVHILKFLRKTVSYNIPEQTPVSITKYQELENLFFYLAEFHFPAMSLADVDLVLWMKYSGRLEKDEKEVDLPHENL